MKSRLGGKGAGLCEMGRIGCNVPPGFTITTDVCADFYEENMRVPDSVWCLVEHAMADLEAEMGYCFGGLDVDGMPLLVSVRSGAAMSMPGMMDTVLNLGLNDRTVEALAAHTNDRFAWDSYRRFLDMYGDVVLGISHDLFEEEMRALKETRKIPAEHDVDLRRGDGRAWSAAHSWRSPLVPASRTPVPVFLAPGTCMPVPPSGTLPGSQCVGFEGAGGQVQGRVRQSGDAVPRGPLGAAARGRRVRLPVMDDPPVRVCDVCVSRVPGLDLRASPPASHPSPCNTPLCGPCSAVKYRHINKITGLQGTAVSVVAMVYGNMSDRSCTGVCFTRSPSNGGPKLF